MKLKNILLVFVKKFILVIFRILNTKLDHVHRCFRVWVRHAQALHRIFCQLLTSEIRKLKRSLVVNFVRRLVKFGELARLLHGAATPMRRKVNVAV